MVTSILRQTTDSGERQDLQMKVDVLEQMLTEIGDIIGAQGDPHLTLALTLTWALKLSQRLRPRT